MRADARYHRQPTGLYAAGWREIWLRTSDGEWCRTWERIMPRIQDEYLDCAVYLFESTEDAKRGTDTGGSGFVVGVPYQGTAAHPLGRGPEHFYVVTNAHVADDCCAIRLNNSAGATKIIETVAADWHRHPGGDDLAVAAIEFVDIDPVRFRYLSTHKRDNPFATKAVCQEMNIGAGDEAFMVGRFCGREEPQRNTPIARFGHLATAKPEPIPQDRRNGFRQESFLVEVHSIPGFSGSPVFVWITPDRAWPDYRSRMAMFRTGDDPAYNLENVVMFLGIDWGYISMEGFTGLSGVVPAWKLVELLDGEELRQMREQKEQNQAKVRARARLDTATRKKR